MKLDKQAAIDAVEDELASSDSEFSRGLAVGLCGAFYMCDLISQAEWERLLARIETRGDQYGEDCAVITYH